MSECQAGAGDSPGVDVAGGSPAGEPGAAPVPHLGYTSDELELVEEFGYRPLARPMMALVSTALTVAMPPMLTAGGPLSSCVGSVFCLVKVDTVTRTG